MTVDDRSLGTETPVGKHLAIGVVAVAVVMASLAPDAHSQTLPVQISKYWCDKFSGSYSGNTCMAPYAAQPGACKIFGDLNVDDAAMTGVLNEVKAARVCLASRVEEAKINSLKLRANLMGYVTAGNADLENKNDPIMNHAFRPENGKASYWTGVSYFLYQCVVETCTAK
jgi:hypothetical protein